MDIIYRQKSLFFKCCDGVELGQERVIFLEIHDERAVDRLVALIRLVEGFEAVFGGLAVLIGLLIEKCQLGLK